MTHQALYREYHNICPGIRTLYLIPDITTFSRHNPYLKLLYEPLIAEHPEVVLHSASLLSPAIIWRRLCGEPSVLHHHWFECRDLRSLLNAFWKLACVALYRKVGGKVVWTLHNRQPHAGQMSGINRVLRNIWARLPHRIHVHCRSVIPELAEDFSVPPERFFAAAHPAYPATRMPMETARQKLFSLYPALSNAKGRLYLMFGYIAPYKGIDAVIDIFRSLAPEKHLLIAGPAKRDALDHLSLLKATAANAPITIIPKHIPDDQVPLFLNAVDVCLFNYRDILTSGGVALAQSYEKHLIIPRIGCLAEIRGPKVQHFSSQAELGFILRET